MTEYIHWNGRLFRRQAIDYVSATKVDTEIVVFFSSGKERYFTFSSAADRNRYLKELMQKLDGTWLEDDEPGQDDAEPGLGVPDVVFMR